MTSPIKIALTVLLVGGLAFGAGALAFGSSGREKPENEPTPSSSAKHAAAESRASAPPVEAAPAEPDGREQARWPAVTEQQVDATAVPTHNLTPATVEQATRLARFAGVQESRMLALADKRIDDYAGLISMLEPFEQNFGKLYGKEREVREQIRVARWESKRYDMVEKAEGYPTPQTPGEVVIYGSVWEPTLGKSMRRVIRVYPGEEPALDDVRQRMESEKAGGQRLAEQVLTAAGF